MDAILLHSGEQQVSAALVVIFSSEEITVQSASSLTSPDHNSPHVSPMYAAPQKHTPNNTV
jgi:hypothetical protein